MKRLWTPLSKFKDLPDYNFQTNFVTVGKQKLTMHYVDEGPRDAKEVVLLLHGEPSWSYLYRKMIPIFVEKGYRTIAPDLIGFGKSDKPTKQKHYTYQNHVDWTKSLIKQLDLQKITLFCQDWGGLIGLRLAAEMKGRFNRIAAANTFLPIGKGKPSDAFLQWREYAKKAPSLPITKIMQNSTVRSLSKKELAAYSAPFPSDDYMAGAKIFPALVPIDPKDPAVPANEKAWKVLKKWKKPFLCLFSDKDPITKGGDKLFLKLIPGTKGQPHTTIKDGGHFLQEDKGEEIAKIMVKWMKKK